jgi:hypothetical protein
MDTAVTPAAQDSLFADMLVCLLQGRNTALEAIDRAAPVSVQVVPAQHWNSKHAAGVVAQWLVSAHGPVSLRQLCFPSAAVVGSDGVSRGRNYIRGCNALLLFVKAVLAVGGVLGPLQQD